MIFNDDEVNIPERLLQALTSDRLVIFVGAGASARAYPDQPPDTFYPDFPDLARAVAKQLGKAISAREQTFLSEGFIDRVLGDWDDGQASVRKRAAEILTVNEDGQRIDLHRAIVRLFAPTLTPRVVTTNFDRLFVRARDAEGLANDGRWRLSFAPALPPVRRFTGICSLHGSVAEPDDMVLTDRDIGRAYMDEGWALRFAHAMFQAFDVLFIGYSLEDPPLRYLSLALEGTRNQGRWVMLREPAEEGSKQDLERTWQRRQVEPIWYRAPGNDYRALEKTIRDWGSDNARSFLNRRSVLGEFGKNKPTHLPPHELSRAELFLQDAPSLRDFATNPLDADWFDTLLAWKHFDFLLKGTGTEKEADFPLLDRLSEWMLSDPTKFLGKLAPFRSTLRSALFDQFCRRFEEGRASALDDGTLLRFLEFFRPAIERASSSLAYLFIQRLLTHLFDRGYEDYGIWLLTRSLTTQSIVTSRPSFALEYARATGQDTAGMQEMELQYELRFTDELSDHRLETLFKNVVRPRIVRVGPKLIIALTAKLLEVRAFQRIGRSSDSHHFRSAIERHEQDRYRRGPFDSTLNALRDAWEELLIVDRRAAESTSMAWTAIQDPLIRRLRVHALRRLIETNAT